MPIDQGSLELKIKADQCEALRKWLNDPMGAHFAIEFHGDAHYGRIIVQFFPGTPKDIVTERERCARIADDFWRTIGRNSIGLENEDPAIVGKRIAAAIRRGTA